MVRSLTANALAEIAKKQGTEPLIIVAIDWYGEGNFFVYADKVITDIAEDARILSVSGLSTAGSNRAGQASDIDIELDDTDNQIKTVLNETNVYHKPATIYQFFSGLTNTDKFVLFKGVVDVPIIWSEDARSVTVQILSEVEDKEIGVSLEETDIIDIDPEVNTEPWPLAFGNVVHVPATKVNQYPIAKLLEPTRLVDQMLYGQLSPLVSAYYDQQKILIFWKLVFNGANILVDEPPVVLAKYIYYIKLEAYYDALIKYYKSLIADANFLKRDRRDKDAVEAAEIDNIPTWRDYINDTLKPLLEAVQTQKDYIEVEVTLLRFKYDLQKAAANNMAAAYNNLVFIYSQYMAATADICRQLNEQSFTLKVEDSENFDQDTWLNLIINNLKWRGYFNSDELHLHPDPLPRYINIAIGPRQSVVDECGDIDEMKGVDLFWTTTNYPLSGMYVLALDVNGNRHILKVLEQDGTKCRFQLVRYGEYNFEGRYGADVVTSVSSLPQTPFGNWGDLPDGWNDLNPGGQINPFESLSPSTLQALSPVLPNDDETRNLREIEKLQVYTNVAPLVYIRTPSPRDVYTCIGPDIVAIQAVSPVPLLYWFNYGILLEEYPAELTWEAKVGDEVREEGTEHDIYVANILPSTIKGVYAYRTVDEIRSLHRVPTSYYNKNESEELYDEDDVLKLTITSLRFPVPLNQIYGENWENEVYITMDSSVGPNTVGIIEHLIDTYTDKSKDNTSFSAVETKLTNYPSSFAVFDRENVYELINDIAMQARCVVFINNDTFYIKYLAEEPTEDVTLSETDLLKFDVSYGDTSDLTTKLVAKWRQHYLPDSERILTLRHNVNRFGIHEKEVDFFIYNIRDLVIKSATFWLIRWANMWKRASVNLPLTQLQLELYDTIKFNLTDNHLADAAVKGIIETHNFIPEENIITVDCWLPIKAGAMTEYTFAWSASAAETDEFPLDIEITEGYAGGSGIGKGIVTIIQGQ